MDDSQQLYAEDSVSRLIKLFQSQFGTYFTTYYEATPSKIPPKDCYPLIIVQKMKSTAKIGPTSTDDVMEGIAISVWLNMADDAGSANVRTTTMRKLQNKIEGLDPVTFDYKADTVLYALRHFLTLTEWLIDSDVSVDYRQHQSKQMPTISACDIVVNTQRRVIVNNRQ